MAAAEVRAKYFQARGTHFSRSQLLVYPSVGVIQVEVRASLPPPHTLAGPSILSELLRYHSFPDTRFKATGRKILTSPTRKRGNRRPSLARRAGMIFPAARLNALTSGVDG